MKKSTRYVGLDVHAQTIAIAVAEGGRDGEVRSLGTIPNTPEAVRKAVKKLGPVENLAVCYEAGPCGHVLYWQLTELGVRCEVVAPTLVPMRSGDRVKTDRRDAEKLARCYRSGDLTAVWVPDAEHEALRDLVRARESAKEDQRRARQHVRHFLLRHGRRPDGATRAWTAKYETWLASVRFEQPALEATMLDYRTEVQHARDRIERLERAIDAALDEIAQGQVAQSALARRDGIGRVRPVHAQGRIRTAPFRREPASQFARHELARGADRFGLDDPTLLADEAFCGQCQRLVLERGRNARCAVVRGTLNRANPRSRTTRGQCGSKRTRLRLKEAVWRA